MLLLVGKDKRGEHPDVAHADELLDEVRWCGGADGAVGLQAA